MRTVVLGPRPAELDALIARRKALGLDTFDEVWEGEYHMAPAANSWHAWLDQQLAEVLGPVARRAGLITVGPFNLGSPDDFRVPDRGLLRVSPGATWLPTAAMVVEIESPDDETWDKLGFYASHGVDEVLVASPAGRSLTWLVRQGGAYVGTDHSALLGPESAGLGARIDWPPTG
ncbi:MAG: Uma2 family endonuclease [Nocardioidaceae bacterium]